MGSILGRLMAGRILPISGGNRSLERWNADGGMAAVKFKETSIGL